jgi:hypothetical protein
MNRTVLLLAGAVSAGVHAGLAPEHLHEWPPLGAAFIAAAASSALAVAALVLRPESPWPPRVLATLLGGMVVAYGLTRLAALPPLDPDREALDLLGVCTCAVEAAGVVAAVRPRLTLVTPGGST